MPDDVEHVVFDVSDERHTHASAHLYVVLLHQLSCRAQLNDLANALKRFTLSTTGRLSIVLDVQPSCPRAVAKAATRLCARHAVYRYSSERPLAAAAFALAGITLEADDFVVVLRDVLPDEGFLAYVADAAATSSSRTLLTLNPPIAVGFAASANLLASFCHDCPLLAGQPDSDILLDCYAQGDEASTVRCLLNNASGEYTMRPLRSYHPTVTQNDIATLDRVMERLGLHVKPNALPALQDMAAGARALLRRSVAAHWRADVDERDAIRKIMHDRDLGVGLFCRRAESHTLPSCLPAFLCEHGIRRFAEELDVRCDGDIPFRRAMMREFPELRKRIAEITRRAVHNLVELELEHDNLRTVRREWE